ncbi:hypothetical protein QTP86_012976 [Hemibagrus guttatus]|nr:hypothetical protein QTP86_012976 [Hemibagrus guttatus]
MTVDRVENHTHVRKRFPRYHNTMFRGQALWDAHTHVVLPPNALVLQRNYSPLILHANQTPEVPAARRSGWSNNSPFTIVIVLIYRSLGAALPPKYHTDRRGVRLPRHPVLNSPVVSVSVYNNHSFVEGFLESPVLLEFRLLETSNRSKPLCVQWNHTSPELKSNTRSIHSNMAAAAFLSQLTYLLGINQTEQQFLCTVVAILLHYFFMSAFAWMFVEALHIYRMQTEARNINYGAMRFYYAIGWGVPAIITGRRGSSLSPDFPLPRHFLQLFRRDPEVFPGQSRDIVSPACPGSSQWGMPGTPPQGDVPEASETDARATSTVPFRYGGSAALL